MPTRTANSISQLLWSQDPIQVTIAVILLGLANILMAAAIGALLYASSDAAAPTDQLWWWVGPLIVAALLRIAGFEITSRLTAELNKSLRGRLVETVSRAELPDMERVGATRIKAGFIADVQSVSRGVNAFAIVVNAASLVIAVILVAMFFDSVAALITAGLYGLVHLIFLRLNKVSADLADRTNRIELRFLERAQALFAGPKDLRIDHWRATDFWNNGLATTIVGIRRARRVVNRATIEKIVFHDSGFNVILAVLVFLVPLFSGSAAALMMILFISYCFDRLASISIGMSAIADGEAALARLDCIAAELPSSAPTTPSLASDFAEITFDDVCFRYPQEGIETDSFAIGPLSFSLKRGEIVFIQGGNGAGKSTMLKVLCGFYPPTTGQITVDECHMAAGAYRSLFAIVLTDFHLFEKLYRIPGNDDEPRKWLSRLKVDHAVGIDQDRFTSTKLSTGQRKRLALIAAIEQARPVLVLDEWTADQDPEFRDHFFKEILPSLQALGKTIIAVTHDDRYFSYCDRLLSMRAGQLHEIQKPALQANLA